MRESHTAILERHVQLASEHQTEPYECAWADEAIFFVYLTSPTETDVSVRAQISADGQRWLDSGTVTVMAPGGSALALPVRHFGGWLRLAVEGASPGPQFDIYLALKG